MKSVRREAIRKGRNSPLPEAGAFSLEIRIRGRTDVIHEELCEGLEDAIRIGEKWFRAFQARNPWFVQDSKRQRIFILLDSETETLMQH